MRSQRHAPDALHPRERHGTHCTGDWVGPRAGLDKCEKISPLPGFDPRTVQPVASRYTEYATQPYIYIYIYIYANLLYTLQIITNYSMNNNTYILLFML